LLVVDDEAAVGDAVARALAHHEVVVVRGGIAALAECRKGSYDLVLCDVMMPEMSGMQLFHELQRTQPAVAARVVFMTGGAFTEAARSFLETVANPVVAKPIDVVVLRALVDELLAKYRVRDVAAGS
jgi:DNA-binding response OmpR family regulator